VAIYFFWVPYRGICILLAHCYPSVRSMSGILSLLHVFFVWSRFSSPDFTNRHASWHEASPISQTGLEIFGVISPGWQNCGPFFFL